MASELEPCTWNESAKSKSLTLNFSVKLIQPLCIPCEQKLQNLNLNSRVIELNFENPQFFKLESSNSQETWKFHARAILGSKYGGEKIFGQNLREAENHRLLSAGPPKIFATSTCPALCKTINYGLI